MSDLHLIWEGSSSDTVIRGLSNVFYKIYPYLSEEETYDLALSFERFVFDSLVDQPNIARVDDQLYYQGKLSDFRLHLVLRSGNQAIFPEVFFISEGLAIPSMEDIADLLDLIKFIIENNLRVQTNSTISETWEKAEYVIYIDKEIVISEDFEKSLLGVFLYLLYLREKFRANPKVCTVISDLDPLILQVGRLENDLKTLTEAEFIKKNPLYADSYSRLYESSRTDKAHHFRFMLFEKILLAVGPYIITREDPKTGTVATQLSEPFKKLFKRCNDSTSTYTLAFVVLKSAKSAHANILIFDRNDRIVERFDPNGSITYTKENEYTKINQSFDLAMTNFAKEKGYLYVNPEDFCPIYGVQSIEGRFKNKVGYCVSWSILYAEERLNSTQERTWVAKNLLAELIIRYHLDTPTEVENWITKRITQIFEKMDQLFISLSSALGLQVKYMGGKLLYFE